jgi:predicted ester cyclase
VVASGAISQELDVAARNQQVVRDNLAEINRGDVRGAASDWAEDAQNFGRPAGPERIQLVLEDILTTFPDYHMEIVEMVAVGDVVVVRCNVTGTHLGVGKLSVNGGMLVGVEPTGKGHEIAHIHWYTLRDGKIVAQYATRDDLGMMRQLGLLTSTAR